MEIKREYMSDKARFWEKNTEKTQGQKWMSWSGAIEGYLVL